jgi:hypothetical protein
MAMAAQPHLDYRFLDLDCSPLEHFEDGLRRWGRCTRWAYFKVRDVGWTDGRTYIYVMFLESVGIRL